MLQDALLNRCLWQWLVDRHSETENVNVGTVFLLNGSISRSSSVRFSQFYSKWWRSGPHPTPELLSILSKDPGWIMSIGSWCTNLERKWGEAFSTYPHLDRSIWMCIKLHWELKYPYSHADPWYCKGWPCPYQKGFCRKTCINITIRQWSAQNIPKALQERDGMDPGEWFHQHDGPGRSLPFGKIRVWPVIRGALPFRSPLHGLESHYQYILPLR